MLLPKQVLTPTFSHGSCEEFFVFEGSVCVGGTVVLAEGYISLLVSTLG